MSNTTTYSSRFRHSSKKPYIQPEPSPIEISFWEVAKPLIPELEREVWIGSYRVDFLIPSQKVIVELYGYEYHSSKDQFTNDRKRERFLQQQGYHLMSFSGREINNDTRACVQEVLEFLYKLSIDSSKSTLSESEPVSLHDRSFAANAASPQPEAKAASLPDHSPLPFSRSTGLSQRLTEKAAFSSDRIQGPKRFFGLRPQQLRILVGFLIFDLLIMSTALLLFLSQTIR